MKEKITSEFFILGGIMAKRIRIIFIIFCVFMFMLSARVWYIQVYCHDELKTAADEQHTVRIQSEKARGIIYDRNMEKITNTDFRYCYLIPGDQCNGELNCLMKSVDGRSIGYKGQDYIVYETEKFNKNITRTLIDDFDAYVFCMGKRYSDNQPASHFVGHLTEENNKGATGIEKMCQNKLSATPIMLSFTADVYGNPLYGSGISEYREEGKINPASIVTTLDLKLQKKVESILEKEKIDGSVVILDVKTGEVVTMASSPDFNPNELDLYIESRNEELINKAIQGTYPPGSVFKIVVAAAALESGLIDTDTEFECNGKVSTEGGEMCCSDHKEGHGKMNMDEAFAKSCNCYFAQVAEVIGGERIISMAKRMGINRKCLKEFPNEAKGNLPPEEEYNNGGLANLSVGQGSLLLTPLEVARMTNIIANEGVDKEITVLMSDKEKSLRTKPVLSKKNAKKIKVMMEKTMTEGTGISSCAHIGIAGKTGSAEASTDGEIVHGWFTGFFPAENPRYTVTVLVENGKTGSASALPVFDEIVNYLY